MTVYDVLGENENHFDKLLHKLDMIDSFISIPECIESLQSMVKNFKDLAVKNSSE